MMRFKKIKDRFKSGKDDNTGRRISFILLTVQRKVADYLNGKTAGWSSRRIKTVFIIFFLVTGSISLFITGRAILSANGPPKTFKVQRLYVPAPIKIPGSKRLQKPDSMKEIHP